MDLELRHPRATQLQVFTRSWGSRNGGVAPSHGAIILPFSQAMASREMVVNVAGLFGDLARGYAGVIRIRVAG
jgi:hypothetical protein